MRRNLLLVIVVGTLVVGGTIWATWPDPPKSIDDASKPKFLYCKQCGREKPYSPAEKDQVCLYCDRPMVATSESVKQKYRGAGPYSQMVMVVFAEVIALMFAIWIVARPRTYTPEEEFIYHFCESCNQKIRYRERQIGLMALCPRCKRPFTYPELDPYETI